MENIDQNLTLEVKNCKDKLGGKMDQLESEVANRLSSFGGQLQRVEKRLYTNESTYSHGETKISAFDELKADISR